MMKFTAASGGMVTVLVCVSTLYPDTRTVYVPPFKVNFKVADGLLGVSVTN